MASDIIGRTPCPECSFAHAHVKRKTDGGEKTKFNYRYCPECGATFFPRNAEQAAALTAKMSAPAPVVAAPAAPAAPAAAAATSHKKTPEPAPKKSLLDGLV